MGIDNKIIAKNAKIKPIAKNAKIKPIALGARLKKHPNIHTLGFKPNFSDYSAKEQTLIQQAKKIYYPTAFYADLFNAMDKKTFPSFHTYKFAMDKIKQTAIFQLQGIPHPKTHIFYGNKQKQEILDHFTFPFIAKKARGSAKGNNIYLIHTHLDLEKYLVMTGPAYIQQYMPIKKDMRIIIIGSKIRLAYWRIACHGNFKTNLSQGGVIGFDSLPQKALDLAQKTAIACGWDDVGIDIIESENQFYVLEGNMKYGTRGFKAAGINYKDLLEQLILKKEI
ncbi:MAG: RimK family alpha-L-glutamate ligase [Desulfobacula sp.]|nr:RimK family alpha-L-glutamate ligase [Desulfobacula sp.]